MTCTLVTHDGRYPHGLQCDDLAAAVEAAERAIRSFRSGYRGIGIQEGAHLLELEEARGIVEGRYVLTDTGLQKIGGGAHGGGEHAAS